MIYALSAIVAVVFVLIILLVKPKLREEYCVRTQNFDDYTSSCRDFVCTMQTPKQSGGKLNANLYISAIKSSLRTLKRKQNKVVFQDILMFEPQIKEFFKQKFDSLEDLPCVDAIPRVVQIADFILKNSGYLHDAGRIAAAINIQNKHKTLCFDEISNFELAFRFVLLKKLAFVLENLKILAKMKRIADKNAKLPTALKEEKAYKQLKDSKLFLSFCADSLKYESEECLSSRRDFISKSKSMIELLFETATKISRTDFSCFYAPLQIFGKYESFVSAGECEKIKFLQLVKTLSDRENIDEFLFAIRIDNYMKSASAGHIGVARKALFGRQFSAICMKNGIALLAAGLSSRVMMNLLFGGQKCGNNSKTTLKNDKFENSFERISKFQTLNFGICIQNGKLKLSPYLPKFVESADVSFLHNGTLHTAHIKRGENKALFLGSTKLTGATIIKLTDKPLDLTYILPKDE